MVTAQLTKMLEHASGSLMLVLWLVKVNSELVSGVMNDKSAFHSPGHLTHCMTESAEDVANQCSNVHGRNEVFVSHYTYAVSTFCQINESWMQPR
jgi:hypothetical protein